MQCRRHKRHGSIPASGRRRKREPTPVFLPGKSHRQRSLACYSPWGHKDKTEQLRTHVFKKCNMPILSSSFLMKQFKLLCYILHAIKFKYNFYPVKLLLKNTFTQFSSVAQSCLTLCHPMDCRHGRPSCPSPTPGVYSNSCPLSRWCHPTILSSVIPFSSRLQSFPASGSETYFHQYDAFHHNRQPNKTSSPNS